MGDCGPLNGLMVCSECNGNMKIRRAVNAKRDNLQYYVCSTYYSKYKGVGKCSLHSVNRWVLEKLIIAEIQRVTAFAREHENDFVALVEKQNERVADSALRAARVELEKSNQRVVELDRIIKRIYEDNVNGRLANERFDKLYADYEAEQKSLKPTITELAAYIEKEQENSRSVERFLKLVKKYTDVTELTAEIARVFIDKIVIFQGEGKGKFRTQRIDIYFNFIGQFKNE
ncbi:hypothetical protein FACS189490_04300 [Clostridia bacterium]|nr:hypothetical protein FACS189490_04300 [Clostridia bacterium]